jgi:hypothetical protein
MVTARFLKGKTGTIWAILQRSLALDLVAFGRLQRLEASFDRLEPGVGRRGASPGNTHEMVDVTLVTTHPFLSTRPPGVDLGKQDKEPPLSGPLRELLELMGQDTSKAQRQALKASAHSVATSG